MHPATRNARTRLTTARFMTDRRLAWGSCCGPSSAAVRAGFGAGAYSTARAPQAPSKLWDSARAHHFDPLGWYAQPGVAPEPHHREGTGAALARTTTSTCSATKIEPGEHIESPRLSIGPVTVSTSPSRGNDFARVTSITTRLTATIYTGVDRNDGLDPDGTIRAARRRG